MPKIVLFGIVVLAMVACAKHDPILPGDRTAIFSAADVHVLNKNIEVLPDNAIDSGTYATVCDYRQDENNVVWDGARKVFAGFPTDNSVSGDKKPVCHGKYVYAGLTTGEVVKVNPKTRQIVWMADVYRSSNMMGGASVVDIVAPIVIYDNSVFVAGLGDAFCRLDINSGDKKWCVDIGSAHPFVIAGDFAFVLGVDDDLYAVRLSDGAVYWKTHIEKISNIMTYENGIIKVGREEIDAKSGKVLD